ncbi:MAG: ribose-5-phosphate isomerase RpiA [Pikeienuella sp.]
MNAISLPQPTNAADKAKYAAASRAADYVSDGMKVGLGTGSTAAWLVRILGERVGKGLQITCVPTSTRTRELAEQCGIATTTLDAAGRLDVVIDGADEFDDAMTLIKGGGGALLQEKIVASAADKMVVITDPSKHVATLGRYPLPIEVVRFGAETTRADVERILADEDVGGRETSWRMKDGERFVADEAHFILDLHLQEIADASGLSARLLALPGVVETGLFIGMATSVVIGLEDGSARVIEQATA